MVINSFGKKGEHPLQKMWYFDKGGNTKKGQQTDFSDGLLPRKLEAEYLRVYSKEKGEKKESVKKAFDEWCKNYAEEMI